TLNLNVTDPVDPNNAGDQNAARKIDGQFNRWFLDPIYRGEYPADIVADVRAVDAEAVAQFEAAVLPGDLEAIAAPIDTMGINYYHGEFVSATPAANAPVGGEAETPRETRSPFPA